MGKCSGGKKLGVSLNFPTEEAFMKYIRNTFAGCQECGTIDLIENMIEIRINLRGIVCYLCNDCYFE